MSTSSSAQVGCDSGTCQCASGLLGSDTKFTEPSARPAGTVQSAAVKLGSDPKNPSPVPSINGIALFEQGQNPPAEAVQELAYAELLRQEAVKAGLLPRHKGLTAPDLNDAERQVVEAMVDGAVVTPQPTFDECQRYFDANKAQFVVGQALHLRHILFAVTPGVNVQALATHAEKALLELLHKNAPAGRFEQLAAELSNCPTSTQGGDLGWVGPEDCAPELANELFHQKGYWGQTPISQRCEAPPPEGEPKARRIWALTPKTLTKLMHSRFGFHIMEVQGHREGEQKSYADVQERIAAQLALQSRSTALRQYMSLLVGQALVEGVDLEGADSPLVQ